MSLGRRGGLLGRRTGTLRGWLVLHTRFMNGGAAGTLAAVGGFSTTGVTVVVTASYFTLAIGRKSRDAFSFNGRAGASRPESRLSGIAVN